MALTSRSTEEKPSCTSATTTWIWSAPLPASLAWRLAAPLSVIRLPISPASSRTDSSICLLALRVCSARFLTSPATTPKPRPASPARAASIVALSASRLVCRAIASMVPERPVTCSSTVRTLARRFSIRSTAAIRSPIWRTAPVTVSRDWVMPVPACAAALCALRAATSIARLADTMVVAVCCRLLNWSACWSKRFVTWSRLPAMSAISTPRVPMRLASSAIRRFLTPSASASSRKDSDCWAFTARSPLPFQHNRTFAAEVRPPQPY